MSHAVALTEEADYKNAHYYYDYRCDYDRASRLGWKQCGVVGHSACGNLTTHITRR